MVDKEKQIKRQNEWKSSLDRIEIYLPKGTKDKWKKAAAESNMTLTEWIAKKCQGD